MTRRAFLLLSALASPLAAGLAGCLSRRPRAGEPMAVDWHRAVQGRRSSRLFVLLPGRGDTRAAFAREGIVAQLQALPGGADCVAVEASLPYYRDQSVVRRLHDEIVQPARAAGYTEVWMVGVSLGGLGSMFYRRDYPHDIAGTILLAPYLGERKRLFAEIEAAGGPLRWEAGEVKGGDFERELWAYLSRFPANPPVWLGYGTEDRLRPGMDLFAGLLPSERVLRVAGGHTWKTWRVVLEALLKKAF